MTDTAGTGTAGSGKRPGHWRRVIVRIALCIVLTLVAALALLYALLFRKVERRVSDDIAELRALVNIPANASFARWEVFSTPEGDLFFPDSSNEYITLIAELQSRNGRWSPSDQTSGTLKWVVPEAPRPWLSAGFRTLLEQHRIGDLNVTDEPGCYRYESRVTKSGRPIKGFICERGAHALLYLTLQSESDNLSD